MKKLFDIAEMRRLYLEEHVSTIKLAEMHGCSNPTIWRYFKKNGIEMNPGRILSFHERSSEHCERISEALKGKTHTEEEKIRIRHGMLKAVRRGHSGCFPKGHKPNITPERNKKISIANRGMKRPDLEGKNNRCWRGGVSFKYSRYLGNDIWDEIRWRILKRDDYTCQRAERKANR